MVLFGIGALKVNKTLLNLWLFLHSIVAHVEYHRQDVTNLHYFPLLLFCHHNTHTSSEFYHFSNNNLNLGITGSESPSDGLNLLQDTEVKCLVPVKKKNYLLQSKQDSALLILHILMLQ